MVAACERAGLRLFVAMVLRFFPQYRAAAELVHAGRLGELGVLRLKRVSYPPRAEDDWYADEARSGGMLLDLMIHDLDYARWLAGNVARVFAKSVSRAEAAKSYALVTLRFKSGAMALLEGGWVYPPGTFRTGFDLAGKDGLIEWHSDGGGAVRSFTEASEARTSKVGLPPSEAEDPYAAQIRHVYRALPRRALRRLAGGRGQGARARPGRAPVFRDRATLHVRGAVMCPDKLRLGIMSFAHLHAEAYVHPLRELPGVDLIGFSDLDKQRGAEMAEAFGLRHFTCHEDLLAEGPDGMLVCSENAGRRELVELAAAAGAHVLCEKPLEVSLEAALAMQRACERHGVSFMTAFPMRFAPSLKRVKARLERGELGRLYGANGVNHSEIPTAHRAWFADKALAGGGAVMDHTVHLADLLRWFLGEEVTEVYAEVANPFRPELEVDTAGLVTLTFQSGVFAAIDCSWSRPPSYPRWGHLNMEIFGERGALQVDAFAQHLTVYGSVLPRDPAWFSWGRDPNEMMIEEFVASIREGREPSVTWRDGFEALRVALACYASAEQGRPVKLEPTSPPPTSSPG